MLFEEFFKKKKIDLATLEKGQPELFLEFKDHYAQMGEKSFDHTKKYWFNRLRHEYPLPVEVKVEKVHVENQIAEQTVAEALTEPTPQAEPAKLGFRPKFKTGATPAAKPAENAPAPQTADDLAKPESPETPQAEQPAAEPAKMGFKPRFKAGVTKPAEEAAPASSSEATDNTDTPQTEQPAAEPTKLGFKPRFKAGVTPNKTVEENTTSEESKAEVPDTATASPEQPTAKLGFKPRFKAGVTTNKSAEEKPVENSSEAASPTVESEPAKDAKNETGEQPAAPKLGFKPRFKAGVTTSKPAEEQSIEAASENASLNAESESAKDVVNGTAEQPAAPKLGFKPRFKAGVTTSKPVEEKPTEAAPENTQEVKAEVEKEAINEGEKPEAPAAPKLGFKPRFKAGVTTTQPAPAEEENKPTVAETSQQVEDASESETEGNPAPAPTTPPAKQPYKPRFNPNMIKPKPPAEGENE